MQERRVRVALVLRRHDVGMNSVERLFSAVADSLPADIEAEVVHLPFYSRRPLDLLRNCLFVRRLSHDVIHVTGDVNYCGILAARRRVLLTVLDLVSLRRLTGVRLAAVRTFWYILPLRRSGRQSTISNYIAGELASAFPRSSRNVRVVHCPLVVERAEPQGDREAVLLQVGTSPNKNVPAAVAIAERLGMPVRIVGQISPELRAVISRSKAEVVELGTLSDAQVADEYLRASVLVFLSFYEGFGMPVIEAQASGLPVVTSTAASLPEVAGEAALLVDPDDVEGAADLIRRLIGSAEFRAEVIARGRQNCARFDPVVVAAQYAEIYRAIAEAD